MKGRPVTAVLAMLFVLAVSAAAFAADPKYTKSSVFGPKITDGVTDEFLQMVRDDPDIKKGKPLRLGGAVTDDDLKKVASLADVLTGLFLERTDQVSDLSPLSNLSGLTYLKLDSLKGIRTLAPLGALVKLKELEIRQVEYPDLAFLAGMNDLESLVFFMQPKTIEDISPLKGKAKLKRLHLYSAPVTDISVLAELAELEDLSLYMIKADDLSPIGGLTKLKRLSLYAIPATDMSPVENLTELRYIWIYATKFEDYSPLTKLTKLEELHGGLSKLDTLEYVEFMPKLKIVRMLREDIIDVSPLAKCPDLTEVVLESITGPVDLAVFAGHKKLTALDVEGCRVLNSEAITALPRLERLDLQKTEGVADFSMFKDLPKLKYICKGWPVPDEQIAP
ncbi:hypothetical protein MASR1M66_10140 [Aminivibrio sp.]